LSDYRAQAPLDAPLEEVWALVGDVYTQVVATFAGRPLEYTPMIDRRDELKELKWSCPTTGGFQHWQLTAAQGGTFVDMEMGVHPAALRYRLFDKTVGRWFIKRWAEQAIDGLRRTLALPRTPGNSERPEQDSSLRPTP
jgi:hypothetical protein